MTKRASLLVIPFLFSAGAFAQDAAMVLGVSVGYNTQRLSLKLTPEQAAEAERLGVEATKASRAGKFGEALDDYAQGTAVMNGIEWTPDVQFASALRAKLDHAMIPSGKTEVSLAPLYPVSRAASARLSATVLLEQSGKQPVVLAAKTPIDPSHVPFIESLTIPSALTGDFVIQVQLKEADDSAPQGLRNAFVKSLPVHLEDLTEPIARLRNALAKAPKSNPATVSAEYTLALCDRADQGEVNPRSYDFRKELSKAQAIVDDVQAGRDPFAGTHGDFRKAYRSTVDQTLQPYRLFIPTAYDGAKPTPLMVALHGMGGDENSMFDSYGKELPVDAEKAGFIVVAPKGRGAASMYRGSAEQDVLDVIAEVERDYKVDRSRVYLMGHSMGGYGTWSIAMDHPELFAALGPISGGGDVNGMAKLREIPQYVTHGDDDRTVNVNSSRSMVEAGRKTGAPITYVEVKGGSHVSVAQPAFAPMIEFFRKQAKPVAVTGK